MDFNEDTYVFNQDEQDEWKEVNSLVNGLRSRYNLIHSKMLDLSGFKLINSKEQVNVHQIWHVKSDSNRFDLILVEYAHSYQIASPGHGGIQYDSFKYMFGYLTTSVDLGHTIIRPETLSDKIVEILKPVEIDFPQFRKFSRMYYVLSDNETALENWLNEDIANLFVSSNGIEVEFKNDECLFRLPKPINELELNKLCDFGLSLDRILSKYSA
jgi:hypothetical protein